MTSELDRAINKLNVARATVDDIMDDLERCRRYGFPQQKIDRLKERLSDEQETVDFWEHKIIQLNNRVR